MYPKLTTWTDLAGNLQFFCIASTVTWDKIQRDRNYILTHLKNSQNFRPTTLTWNSYFFMNRNNHITWIFNIFSLVSSPSSLDKLRLNLQVLAFCTAASLRSTNRTYTIASICTAYKHRQLRLIVTLKASGRVLDRGSDKKWSVRQVHRCPMSAYYVPIFLQYIFYSMLTRLTCLDALLLAETLEAGSVIPLIICFAWRSDQPIDILSFLGSNIKC